MEDHQVCRLFISNLRKDLKDNAAVDTLQQNTRWFWRNKVTQMMLREETILSKYRPVLPAMIKKLKDDHEDILELLISIDHEPERFTLNSLANLLEMHVIWEERELLPTLSNVKI